MAATLITAYVGQGTFANRPGTPILATGTIGYYYATDQQVLYMYVNGAWTVATAKSLLATQSPSGVSNITFSSIPSGFKDLELRIRGRASDAINSELVQLQFNGDTGSNYDYQQENRFGRGTANSTTFLSPGSLVGASATANYDNALVVDIFNYSGTTFFKSARCYQEILQAQNDAGMFEQTTGGWWRSTSAINAIKVTLASGNFVAGSVVSLYGIPG